MPVDPRFEIRASRPRTRQSDAGGDGGRNSKSASLSARHQRQHQYNPVCDENDSRMYQLVGRDDSAIRMTLVGGRNPAKLANVVDPLR
jgi:hypothetical protein